MRHFVTDEQTKRLERSNLVGAMHVAFVGAMKVALAGTMGTMGTMGMAWVGTNMGVALVGTMGSA